MTRLQGQLEAAMVKASREAQAKNVGSPEGDDGNSWEYIKVCNDYYQLS